MDNSTSEPTFRAAVTRAAAVVFTISRFGQARVAAAHARSLRMVTITRTEQYR